MRNLRRRRESGTTLLELTFALALFAIIMGSAAQTLVTYYASLDLQNQRNVAAQHCRAVLSDMRALRDAGTGDFPDVIVEQWPNGSEVVGLGTMLNEVVTVTYEDDTADPLVVTVQSSWLDMRGRSFSMQVSTVLTNR